MAKTKIVIENLPVFQQSCELSDCIIQDFKKIGKVHTVIVSYKHPSQLFNCGKYYDQVMNTPITETGKNEIKNDTGKTDGKKEIPK